MLEENAVILDSTSSLSNYMGKRIRASKNIPYNLIANEFPGSSSMITNELMEINRYYNIYELGAKFFPEGNNGDYVAADLRYKMCCTLINKEARFLFAESPDISVEVSGDTDKATEAIKNNVSAIDSLVKKILSANNFDDMLLKAAKDCFIGKRVAYMVNFNEKDGVTISFIPSNHFYFKYRTGSAKELEKFVCFIPMNNSLNSSDRRIFKKKFEVINEKVYVSESIHDGSGQLIESAMEEQDILLDKIPAGIILNDGLTGDDNGESEVYTLMNFESWYSKLANADIDADRKSMNPIRYTVDMEGNSTKNLSSSAGSFWDLQSDQNLDSKSPQVGLLESSMGYSSTLEATLKRIKNNGYEQLDMPDINLETMVGSITSGKALKAIYWPMIVRCKEKMKAWGPKIKDMVDIIIKGAQVYPDSIKEFTEEIVINANYEIIVNQNIPIQEDEIEEKQMNLSEVESKVMSRKTYMKKWFEYTDSQVEEELKQIALERETIEDTALGINGFGEDIQEPYPEDTKQKEDENIKEV